MRERRYRVYNNEGILYAVIVENYRQKQVAERTLYLKQYKSEGENENVLSLFNYRNYHHPVFYRR